MNRGRKEAMRIGLLRSKPGEPFLGSCSAQGDMVSLRSGTICSKHGYTVPARWPHAEWTRPPFENLHWDTRNTAGAASILSSLRDFQTGLEWIEEPGAEEAVAKLNLAP